MDPCRPELFDGELTRSPCGKFLQVARLGEAIALNLTTRHLAHAKRLRGKGTLGTTRLATSYRDHHRRRFDTDMDNIQGSFSDFKKDIKQQLGRIKRKGDKLGLGGRDGSAGSSSSFSQSESRVLTDGWGELGGDGQDTGNENAGASAVNRPGWGTTASSSAKLVLRGVRDSADAFGPLKSVAGGLCFILENYEVQYLPWWVISETHVSAENKGEQAGD